MNLPGPDQVDILSIVLKQLNIDQIRFLHKPSRKGCKVLSTNPLQVVWEFWHQHSVKLTNANQVG